MPDNASRQGPMTACERSLRRLRTEYLDCYLLHWPSRHRLTDTIAAFEQLVRDGKIGDTPGLNFAIPDQLFEPLGRIGETLSAGSMEQVTTIVLRPQAAQGAPANG